MELRITNKILDMAEDPRGFDVQPPVSEAREELAALTSERYQDEQTIADLEAELKTKKRDTEHLLELGKQITAIASERDRLREALKEISRDDIRNAKAIARAALDKDA